MEQLAVPMLAKWESFYVIVGSSAGALTGLQFVVIALGVEAKALKRQAIRAFATPTIVHFCAVLLMSTILSAPWQALSQLSNAVMACGIAGFCYTLLVVRRTRKQTDYSPVFEDWLCHTALPLIAYLSFLVASILLRWYPAQSLFVIGAAAILLLFVGIHNAWDAVTYIATSLRNEG
jgi:hypothetical protein